MFNLYSFLLILIGYFKASQNKESNQKDRKIKRGFLGMRIKERLDFIIWEEKNVTDPDLITRIYPKSLFVEDREEGRKAFFLTDKCYTLEEFNKELDLFQNDIENIRKEAGRRFGEFNEKKIKKTDKEN